MIWGAHEADLHHSLCLVLGAVCLLERKKIYGLKKKERNNYITGSPSKSSVCLFICLPTYFGKASKRPRHNGEDVFSACEREVS